MTNDNSTTVKISNLYTASHIFPWIVCGLGALFFCYEYLLRILPSVMTTDLMYAFGLNAGALGDLIAFYYYIYTPMQLPVGVLMDRYGPRRLLVIACLFCVVGSYAFAQTTHASMIAFSRLLMGFGSAFAFVGVLKLASVWLPPNRFAMVSGLATALGMIGAVIGDNVMAAFVNSHGWRNTVLYSTYLGIGLALLIFFVMRDRNDYSSKTSSKQLPATSFKALWPEIVILVKKPQIWLNGIIGCLLYLPTSAFAELWGIPYLQTAYGFPREVATGAISMIFLGWAVGAPLAGLISDRTGKRCLPIIVGALISSLLSIILIYFPGLTKVSIYGLMLTFGIFSSVQVIVFAIGREISPGEVAGTAVAMTNMLVMVGGVIFQPVIGRLLDMFWSGLKVNGLPVYTVMDYKYALLVIPVGLVLSALLMFFIKETHGRQMQ